MRSLEGWCFEFRVESDQPTPYQEIDVLLGYMIEWAEEYRLGIGDGFHSTSGERMDAASSWHFQFGLCAQSEEGCIAESRTGELWELVRSWCHERRYTLSGGFHEFEQDEP